MGKKRKNGRHGKNGKNAALHGPAWGSQPGASASGVLGRLEGLLGKRPRDQFLAGALLGAAAVYVLGDEALRGKLLKSGLQWYDSARSGLAELQEQLADMRAEIDSERDAASQ